MKITRAGLPWIIAMMVPFVAHVSSAQEPPNMEDQQVMKIDSRLEEAFQAWKREPKNTRPSYGVMIRKQVDGLSQDDIKLLAKHGSELDIDEEIHRKWGTFDPTGALKSIRKLEDENAAEISKAGTGLEGGPGEGMAESVAGMYIATLSGWAEKSPKAAWEYFNKREGAFSGSRVIDDYLSGFHTVLLEALAKVEPDTAFNEILTSSDSRKDEFIRAHMLAGYLRGAPKGRDWRAEAERLLAQPLKHDWVQKEVRVALMGRWLEDAADTAEEWFRTGDIEEVQWSLVSPPGRNVDPFLRPQDDIREKKQNDLSAAAGYWAARDFQAAWNWMKTRGEIKREGFTESVMRGAADYFDEDGWGPWNTSRAHFRKELAKLPGKEDRGRFALLFADKLWKFDENNHFDDPDYDRTKWLEDVRKSLSDAGIAPDTIDGIIAKIPN